MLYTFFLVLFYSVVTAFFFVAVGIFALVPGFSRWFPCWSFTWASLGLKLGNIPCQIIGDQEKLKIGPKILIFNHSSTLDVFSICLIMPPSPALIGKKELKYIPFLNLAFWAMGFLFLDRKSQNRVEQLNRYSLKMSERKSTLVISPEGTRSNDGKLGPFKDGAFHLAINLKLPILPVFLIGNSEVWPLNSWLPKLDRSGIQIKIGDFIDTTSWSKENVHLYREQVRNLYLNELSSKSSASSNKQ